MNARKIRMGLVGCGRISANHFDALAQLKEAAELACICDIDAIKLQAAKEKTGVKNCYSTIKDMLANEKLDLVTISTPNGFHASEIVQIAEAGVSVVTEKPLAITWEDGLRAYNVCKEKGVKLFVIYQNRFNNTMQAVWKALSEGRFGKIYMITSNVFWQRPQGYFDKEATWHGTKDIDGGAYFTQASHYVDMIQWLARAEPVNVYARLKTLARQIETEDCGIAQIEFANGIMSSINVTVLAYPNNLEGSINIIGEKGTVRVGGNSMNKIEHWVFSDSRPEDQEIINMSYETNSVYGFGHVHNYQDIFNDLNGVKPALINGEEGLKSLKILSAIYEANAQNKPVVF